MNNLIAQKIGNKIISDIDNDMRKQSGNNYTLSDYIEDFEGTEGELIISLIHTAHIILKK